MLNTILIWLQLIAQSQLAALPLLFYFFTQFPGVSNALRMRVWCSVRRYFLVSSILLLLSTLGLTLIGTTELQVSVVQYFLQYAGGGLWIGSMFAVFFVFFPAFLREPASEQLLKHFHASLGKLIGIAIVLGAASGMWSMWIAPHRMINFFSNQNPMLLIFVAFAALAFALRMCSFFLFERMKRCVPCVRAFALLEVLVALPVSFFFAATIITPSPTSSLQLNIPEYFDVVKMLCLLLALGFGIFGIFIFRVAKERELLLTARQTTNDTPSVGKFSLFYGVSVLAVLLFGAIALLVTHLFFSA